jgi:hypothetical protein
MGSSRLPRFKRSPHTAPLRLTDRDREIIRLVYTHRFIRSHHIVALIGGSPQQILRRLQLLYHQGYLERPRAQIDSYHRGGSRRIAYGLGNKGGMLLKQTLGVAFRNSSWNEKNQAVGRMFLEHGLLVSDVMATIEIACRKAGVRFIAADELLKPQMERPLRWSVRLGNRAKVRVVPDRVFAIEYPDAVGTSVRANFFLEADRGTMPVQRSNVTQSSFHRKLLTYEATWAQSIHRTRFGFSRFRVVTVTTSATRVASLVRACAQLKSGHGLFLFADRSILEMPGKILSVAMKTGRDGEFGTLLDSRNPANPARLSV